MNNVGQLEVGRGVHGGAGDEKIGNSRPGGDFYGTFGGDIHYFALQRANGNTFGLCKVFLGYFLHMKKNELQQKLPGDFMHSST